MFGLVPTKTSSDAKAIAEVVKNGGASEVRNFFASNGGAGGLPVRLEEAMSLLPPRPRNSPYGTDGAQAVRDYSITFRNTVSEGFNGLPSPGYDNEVGMTVGAGNLATREFPNATDAADGTAVEGLSYPVIGFLFTVGYNPLNFTPGGIATFSISGKSWNQGDVVDATNKIVASFSSYLRKPVSRHIVLCYQLFNPTSAPKGMYVPGLARRALAGTGSTQTPFDLQVQLPAANGIVTVRPIIKGDTFNLLV